MTDKLNVHQKLSIVRGTIPYLKKEKSGKQFNYVGSSDVLGALHGVINEQGLLLIPSIIDHKVTEGATKAGTVNYFTELKMIMTWVNIDNPEDKIECPWYAQGMDLAGEKGVGKALTYAEKYFMLKFFNIATDKDDPDAFQSKTENKLPPKLINDMQQKVMTGKLNEFADLQGTDLAEILDKLSAYLNVPKVISNFTEENFGTMLNYLNNQLNGSKSQLPRQNNNANTRAWEKN